VIGARLKQLRAEKEISQEELGKILNISTSMVGMYETDVRNPSFDVLIKIANFFDCTTDYLLGRTDTKKFSVSDIIIGTQAEIIEEEVKKRLRERIIKAFEE
jgi:transcriptional regulator with XRE-family HTH domain